MSLFALVDGNNFYTSCERVFRPDLIGKPIVVLSNNDGCIVSRSAEAKAMGIRGFVPYFQVAAMCRHHQVAVFSSNYALYGDMSRRMMAVIARWGREQELYSIDESFITLDSMPNLREHATGLRDDVLKCTGIPTCVGMGSSKTLAKLANHVAKTRPKTKGVFAWDWLDSHYQQKLMGQIPVEEVWGVGRGLTQRLHSINIRSALDLKQANQAHIKRLFNVVLERTVAELNGVNCLELDDVEQGKKQIINSRSFAHTTSDHATLASAITHHASRAAEKLRQQHSVARLVGVRIRSNPFADDGDPYRGWTVVPLVHSCADSMVITKAALAGLDQIYRPDIGYKKAGVMLMELSDERQQHPDLFDSLRHPRRTAVMQAMDQINRHYGGGTLKLASETLSDNWHMRQENRSLRCTTRWDELLVVG